jgi:MoxR-like ATPase
MRLPNIRHVQDFFVLLLLFIFGCAILYRDVVMPQKAQKRSFLSLFVDYPASRQSAESVAALSRRTWALLLKNCLYRQGEPHEKQ